MVGVREEGRGGREGVLPKDSLTPMTSCESKASPLLSAQRNFMAAESKRSRTLEKILLFQL